jgi:glutamyl-tRNA synthetase
VSPPAFPLENQKAAKLLAGDGAGLVAEAAGRLAALDTWEPSAMEELVRDMAEQKGLGLGKIAQPLRAALTGSNVSPGIFEIMQILGREESLQRLSLASAGAAAQET